MKEHRSWVYLVASRSGLPYTGVTNNLERRVWAHKHSIEPRFTQRCKVNRLVFFQEFGQVEEAIAAEKQINGWVRAKRLALIRAENPTMRDLSEGWYR